MRIHLLLCSLLFVTPAQSTDYDIVNSLFVVPGGRYNPGCQSPSTSLGIIDGTNELCMVSTNVAVTTIAEHREEIASLAEQYRLSTERIRLLEAQIAQLSDAIDRLENQLDTQARPESR